MKVFEKSKGYFCKGNFLIQGKEKTTTIAKRLSIFVITINLLVSTIVFFIQVKKDKKEFELNLNEKLNDFEKGLSTLSNYLYSEDDSAVQTFLMGIVAQTDFKYASIKDVDEKEKILYEFPPLDAIPKFDKSFEKKVFKLFFQKYSLKEYLGDLTIMASRYRIEEKIKGKTMDIRGARGSAWVR